MAMRGDRLDELELGPMTPENSAFGGTAFTVSIDLRNSTPRDSAPPGHVFPRRGRPGGALERRGQTGAAVDLTVPAKSTRPGQFAKSSTMTALWRPRPTGPGSVRPTVSSCLGLRTSRDNRLGRGSGNAPKTEDD